MLKSVEKRNLALINAYELSSFARRSLGDGATTLDRVASFAQDLPHVAEVRYITKSGVEIQGDGTCLTVNEMSPKGLLSLFPTDGFDDVYYFFADCPFLDIDITASLYERHARYLAQYSFSDGYPYGLVPEIVATEIVPKLRSLAEGVDSRVERDTLFSVIQEDINAFDVETDLSPRDQRMLRVSLSADTLRNVTILERIVAAGGTDAESITSILDNRPELLRSQPAYVSVQITDGCPQSCSYCPFPQFGGDIVANRNEMALSGFARIASEVARFCGDAVFNISTWGEPAYHSDLEAIVEAALSISGMSMVIETSGIGWKPGVIERLSQRWESAITWILSLDAVDAALYRQLRGDGLGEALRTAEILLDVAKDTAYIQAVRMRESEEALESFYRHWKAKTDNVIIQKYATHGGTLPERKVTDLSPLNRFPCWHIKRDLIVLLDGTVPVCREDVDRAHILGNLFEDSIELVWERGEDWYNCHIRGDYPDLCRNCDEYYTFNY